MHGEFVAGWVAGGCWDDDITNVMIAGSFPKIPCVKRTKISKMIQQQSSSPARAPADS